MELLKQLPELAGSTITIGQLDDGSYIVLVPENIGEKS